MLKEYSIISVRAYWGDDLPMEHALFSEPSTWLELADYYNVFISPNVYIYESFQHLQHLLATFQWRDDRAILENHVQTIQNTWIQLLKPVFPGAFL